MWSILCACCQKSLPWKHVEAQTLPGPSQTCWYPPKWLSALCCMRNSPYIPVCSFEDELWKSAGNHAAQVVNGLSNACVVGRFAVLLGALHQVESRWGRQAVHDLVGRRREVNTACQRTIVFFLWNDNQYLACFKHNDGAHKTKSASRRRSHTTIHVYAALESHNARRTTYSQCLKCFPFNSVCYVPTIRILWVFRAYL